MALLNDHVNSHFDQSKCFCSVRAATFQIAGISDAEGASKSDDGGDYQLALELDRQEREARRQAEMKEFEHLRVSLPFYGWGFQDRFSLQREYGMDETGSYNQQGLQALNRAYGKGQMTLGQLYDAKQRLSMNENAGIEDPNYPTKSMYIPLLFESL